MENKSIKKRSGLKKVVLVFFIMLIFGVLLTLFSTSFQTYITSKYLSYLSKQLGVTVKADQVGVSFINSAAIKGLYIEDLKQDTLLYIDEINLSINDLNFGNKLIDINRVELKKAQFNLAVLKDQEKSNLNFLIQYFSSKDSTKSKWNFRVNNITLEQTNFTYNNYNYTKKETGIDYKHINVSNLNTIINKLVFDGETTQANIKSLSLQEQSGFELNKFKSKLTLTKKLVDLKRLEIITPTTNISTNLSLKAKSFKDYTDFINKVSIKSSFDSSYVNFSDIAYFSDQLQGLNKSLSIQGDVKGRVNNLKGKRLKIKLDDGTYFKGNVDLTGLPNIKETFMHVSVKKLITSSYQLKQLPLPPFTSNKKLSLPKELDNLGKIEFNGLYTGFYNDFVAYGNFYTDIGDVKTDLKVSKNDETNKPIYEGDLVSNQFDLGKLFNVPKKLGKVTMEVSIKGEGIDKQAKGKINGLINEITVLGYDYSNIELNGEINNQKYEGYFCVEDENIIFDFDGVADLSGKLPRFTFISNISNAKLAKLNLISSKQKLKTRFSTKLYVDIEGNSFENIEGTVKFEDSYYTDKLDEIYIQKAVLSSLNLGNKKLLTVNSDVLDATVNGIYNFKEIAQATTHSLQNYLPSLSSEKEYVNKNDFRFDVQIHNSDLITKIFLKDYKIDPNTRIKGFYKGKTKTFFAQAISPHVNTYNTDFNNVIVNLESSENDISCELLVNSIVQSDSIYLNNFSFVAKALKDSIATNIAWDNTDSAGVSNANINIGIKANSSTSYSSKIRNSYITFNGVRWDFNDVNYINIDTSFIKVQNLSFKTEGQGILLDGIVSKDSTHQLDVALNNFNLDNLKKIIPRNIVQLKGNIDGTASLTDAYRQMVFTSDLKLKKFEINNNMFGDGLLQASWDKMDKALHVNGEFYKGHIPSIIFGGVYYPTKLENNINLSVQLQRTDLRLFQVYLDDYLSSLRGIGNGKLSLTGSIKEPVLEGQLNLQKTSFLVNFTKTSYSIPQCKVQVYSDMIAFDNITVFDEFANKASLTGTVFHEYFKNVNIDVGIDMNNFLCLNTNEIDNNLYHGRAFMSGLVNVGGYEEEIYVDLAVKTEKNTVFNIPLDGAETVEENNFIRFTLPDSSLVENTEDEKADLSNIHLNFDLEVTPDAEVRLIFDEKAGDVMRSRGSGDLNLGISTQGEFNMYGQYVVKEGDYLFTLENIINKKFIVEEGGTITWDGSPYDAVLDLNAVYRVRARLYDLLLGVDTSDVYKKRIPINVKLEMTNNMMSPNIDFDIDLPTADESTKEKVNSVLQVGQGELNDQELNKQVFSLLVLNRFITPQGVESANYEHTGVGASSSSELLSNQLSNWLSKISNDFDVGFNYRPGDELSNDEVELALSTQIFNDRVIIDGNVGYSNQDGSNVQTQEQANDLVGDVTVEYKLSEDGSFRVKAFNRSNQYSLIQRSSPYTQGVGLFYKEEFDTGKEFFNKFFNRFRRKKKKFTPDE